MYSFVSLLLSCGLPACLQVVSTADLIFVFGSAAEIRDHLKNVKDSIKDRLIVPVTREGQIDTFQVSSDTGDSGAVHVSIAGPFLEGKEHAGCHVLPCRAELSECQVGTVAGLEAACVCSHGSMQAVALLPCFS